MLSNVHEAVKLTHGNIDAMAAAITEKIDHDFGKDRSLKVFPIPRGGIPATYALMLARPNLFIVDDPEDADFFFDDLVDSGKTMFRWTLLYKHPFYALMDKRESPPDGWIVFPWEGDVEGSTEDFTVRLLQYIGEDPTREGLRDTPARVSRAWKDWTAGYALSPADVLKDFADGGETYDEMVMVRNIPFYSQCEHHLAPFFGVAHIAYIPNGRIVGLSKLSRLLDIYARRLQVQERLTAQVADALMEHLHAKGAAVSLHARHLCMESRGIQKQNSETVTNVLRGVFLANDAARAEFLASARG